MLIDQTAAKLHWNNNYRYGGNIFKWFLKVFFSNCSCICKSHFF